MPKTTRSRARAYRSSCTWIEATRHLVELGRLFVCSLDEGLRVTQRLRNVYHDCARPE